MKKFYCTLGAIVAFALAACSPDSSQRSKASYDIRLKYQQVGYHQGAKPIFGTYFVYVNLEGVSNEDAYISFKNIAIKLCENKNICFVHFWDDEIKAGHSLPMTESEANSKIAGYNINRNTGNHQFQCQPFADPGKRCAK